MSNEDLPINMTTWIVVVFFLAMIFLVSGVSLLVFHRIFGVVVVLLSAFTFGSMFGMIIVESWIKSGRLILIEKIQPVHKFLPFQAVKNNSSGRRKK